MLSEEEKDSIKISVPLYTNQELSEMENVIQNDFNNIVDEVSEQVYHDRELKALQKIIEKQQAEIEDKNQKLKRVCKEANNEEIKTKELKVELEKKNKIIDKMAEYIAPLKNEKGVAWTRIGVKEYFTKLVEEEN